MARMVRKQVYIEPEQERLLKDCAREMGISEAEVIRRGIIEVAQRRSREKAWAEALGVMKERARMKVPQTGRTWTRDELYEERFERYSRRQ